MECTFNWLLDTRAVAAEMLGMDNDSDNDTINGNADYGDSGLGLNLRYQFMRPIDGDVHYYSAYMG